MASVLMKGNKCRKVLSEKIKGNSPRVGPPYHTFAGIMSLWEQAYPKKIGQ